jgi:L-lactate dehydrogenase
MENKNVDEILLINRTMETSEGLYLELSSAFPELAKKLKVAYFEDAEKADIVIIVSGIPQFPLQKRIDLLKTNEKIINEVFDMIKLKPTAILLVITNPVDLISYIAWKRSGLKPNQIIGFGGYLDTNRLKYLISKETGKDPDKIECYVIGEHGEDQIPIFREDVLNRDEIIFGVRNYIQDVISKIGASMFAPAKLACDMVDSIIKDEKKIFCVSHYDKDYGMYITWPCVVGKNGIIRACDIKLTEKEKEDFKKLIEDRKKYIANIPLISKKVYLKDDEV